jgi:hypothetical protein
MQDIQLSPPDLCARWEEQVPYFGTRRFSKCLANVLDIPHVPSSGPAAAPPVGIVEVDHEEGSNPEPDHHFSWQTRPAAKADQRVPEDPQAADVAVVAIAPTTVGTTTGLPRVRAWERKEAGRLRSALLQDSAPEPTPTNGPGPYGPGPSEKENTMSKKLYAPLLPFLAVVAFAVIPAVAQAAPHWYSNGVRIPFRNTPKVAVTTHSTPAGLSLIALGHEIICTVSDTGHIWNPANEGAGLDEVNTFVNTACVATPPICPAGTELEVIATELPWKTHLTGPPFRIVIEGVEIDIQCSGVLVDTFRGTLSTAFHNGTAGSLAACTATPTDSFGEFDAESGTLVDAEGNKATADGKDCIWGPSGDEIITVKNP